jgi:pilus assembly protein CpaE
MTVLPEMVGLRNTRLMLDQLRERGYSEDKTWIVLNRADIRAGVPQADIEARLKVHVRYRVPDDQGLATHTVNRGVPLMLSHPGSGLARAVRKFAIQLSEDLVPASLAEESGGLFSRLLGRGPVFSSSASEA